MEPPSKVMRARVAEENGKKFALIPLSPTNPAMKTAATRKYRLGVERYLSGLLLTRRRGRSQSGGQAIDPRGER
jgi:hypothetical protein